MPEPPQFRMEHTPGLGRQAEVWVDGALLAVCDGISPPGGRTPPGAMEDVALTFVCMGGVDWAEAVRTNPMKRQDLDPQKGYSYVGYGRVLDTMPVTIDFGMVTMTDGSWAHDDRLVGRYVRLEIDRLELVPVSSQDFPEPH
jgi:hypothetical protein